MAPAVSSAFQSAGSKRSTSTRPEAPVRGRQNAPAARDDARTAQDRVAHENRTRGRVGDRIHLRRACPSAACCGAPPCSDGEASDFLTTSTLFLMSYPVN